MSTFNLDIGAGRPKEALTRRALKALEAARRRAVVANTAIPLRTERMSLADLPPGKYAPGELFQMEVDRAVLTKMAGSKAVANTIKMRSACVF